MSFALPLMIFALSFMPYVGKTLINDVRGVATIMQTYVVNKVQGNADDEEDNIEKQLERKRDEGEISANTVAIIENVFLYRSSRNKLMLFASEYIPLTGVFVCAMIIIGFVLRRWEWFDIWMTYLILFCAISPSMAMQYYAIPAAPVAILWCPFGLLYHMLLSVFYALPDKGYSVLKSWAYVMNMIVLLLCIRTLARKKVVL